MTKLSVDQINRINKTAKRKGKKYVENDVTTNQLRQIYSEVKRAQNEFRYEDDAEKAKQTLMLLKPRLAYSAARSDEMKMVEDEFSRLIDKAINGGEQNMEIFFHHMEAIVAYHAYFNNGDDQ